MRRPNTTFDIYLNNSLPPAVPDVSGETGYLADRFAQGQEHSESHPADFVWSSILEVRLGVNLPDNYPDSASQTTVWAPDKNGTGYRVLFTERRREQRGAEFLRAYLTKAIAVAIEVREVDLNPDLTNVVVLEFHQDDGFVVSQPAANQARVRVTITDAMLSISDVTTNNASTTKHGFLKKLDNDATHFLNGQ